MTLAAPKATLESLFTILDTAERPYMFATTTEEIITMTNDAHHNEYLGAAAAFRESAGWHDTTNTQPTLAAGDFISGMTCGKHWSGRIEWIDGDRLTINVGGGWLAVSAKDITF